MQKMTSAAAFFRYNVSLTWLVKGKKAKQWTMYEPPHDKTNKMTVRPAKTQISLGIRPVWSESSLCAQWVAKDPSFLHADSEDWSDWADAQADLSHRRVHVILLVLSWGGSYRDERIYDNIWKAESFFFVKIKLNNARQCIDVRSECSFQAFLSAYHIKCQGNLYCCFGNVIEFSSVQYVWTLFIVP